MEAYSIQNDWSKKKRGRYDFGHLQVNNGVLYVLAYVEDIYIRVLSLHVSILNPYLVSFIFVLNTCDDYGYVVLYKYSTLINYVYHPTLEPT